MKWHSLSPEPAPPIGELLSFFGGSLLSSPDAFGFMLYSASLWIYYSITTFKFTFSHNTTSSRSSFPFCGKTYLIHIWCRIMKMYFIKYINLWRFFFFLEGNSSSVTYLFKVICNWRKGWHSNLGEDKGDWAVQIKEDVYFTLERNSRDSYWHLLPLWGNPFT